MDPEILAKVANQFATVAKNEGGKAGRDPDAFDYARAYVGPIVGLGDQPLKNNPVLRQHRENDGHDSGIVNALMSDSWPQHKADDVTSTIAALQAGFETLPSVFLGSSISTGMRHLPYTLTGEMLRAIEMLRSYRMACEVVHQRDERQAQERRDEAVESRSGLERTMAVEQYVKQQKEARRAKRSRRK